MRKPKIDLARLMVELSHRMEERELLVAAERYLSIRERYTDKALLAICEGNQKDAETLRRIVSHGIKHGPYGPNTSDPQEITKRLCWPDGMYAAMLANLDDDPVCQNAPVF